MKHILLFAMFFAAFSVVMTTPVLAKSAKAEPAPISPEDNDEGSREETYEDNDREGSDENDFSDLFSAPVKADKKSVKIVTEDRGATVVVTTTRYRDAFPEDNCAFVTIQVMDKKTGELLGSDSISTCDTQIQ